MVVYPSQKQFSTGHLLFNPIMLYTLKGYTIQGLFAKDFGVAQSLDADPKKR